MPFRSPDPVAHIFDGHTIEPENIVLDTEDPRPPSSKEVRVRALDGFLFVKDGKFVYPNYARPKEWWVGVIAYGYIAALTGDYKYFIWAGQWDYDYDGKHIEVVILANLLGISQESNYHWRNGAEDALWLETDQGFSYALLEPAEEYDRGCWASVTESWRDAVVTTRQLTLPVVKLGQTRPRWWDSQGDDAWDYFVGLTQPVTEDRGLKVDSLDSWLVTPKNKKVERQIDYVQVDSGSSDEEIPILDSTSTSSTGAKNKKVQRRRGKPGSLRSPGSQRATRESLRIGTVEVRDTTSDEKTLVCSGFRPESTSSRVVKGSYLKSSKPDRSNDVSAPRIRQKRKISEVISVASNSSDEDAKAEGRGQKDQYCYICEDGGNIIECCWCSHSCCYNIIGQRGDNPTGEPEACVSIPQSMASGEDVVFPCPSCASERGLSSIGYFINQGARATMRVASRMSVAIIIYHLNAYNAVAKSLSEQLNSALSAFYVNVACQTRLIHRGFTPEEAETMFEEIPRDSPYHVAVIFITEGDPQGGWWHTSNYGSQKDGRIAEQEFLGTCLHNLRKLAAGAISARLFGVACGYNLRVKGGIEQISEYLRKTSFVSVVLPSTCSLLTCEYLPLLSEIFINVYYFGIDLNAALMRTWGKSRQARTHTGLLVMERSSLQDAMSVRMLMHAPVVSHPLGVPLPVAHTICGCPEFTTGWDYKKEIPNPPETIFLYRSICCGVELQVGIHPGPRRQIISHEVKFAVELWDKPSGSFLFNESSNVQMKIMPPRPKRAPSTIDRSAMWTKSGRKAVKYDIKLKEGTQ